jgi:tetrathionate reductase subunit B
MSGSDRDKTRDEAPDPARRAFLKNAAAGVGAAIAATAAGATEASAQGYGVGAAARPANNVQYGMLIDTRRCIGCHACTVACKSQNATPVGVNRSWVEYVEKGEFPNTSRSFLPRLCNQCTHPPCVSVCPANATWKREEDGVVIIDPDVCIGCKYCIQACPYNARFLNPETGTADKCDFCIGTVSKGGLPACVETCVGGARIFGDLNDPNAEISKLVAKNPVSVLRAEQGTVPNVYYIGADLSDEHSAEHRKTYIRVTTHRPDGRR